MFIKRWFKTKKDVGVPCGEANKILDSIRSEPFYFKMSFEDMENELAKAGDLITAGILIADWNKTLSRSAIYADINRFDENSGRYIDFFLVGYEEKDDRNKDLDTVFTLRRTGKDYCFNKDAFDSSVRELEKELIFQYSYNPTLILVEFDRKRYRGELRFQKRIVIELEKIGEEGIGKLFDAIYDVSKRHVKIVEFSRALSLKCIKKGIPQVLLHMMKKDLPSTLKELFSIYVESSHNNTRKSKGHDSPPFID